jgi:hypothetical protein
VSSSSAGGDLGVETVGRRAATVEPRVGYDVALARPHRGVMARGARDAREEMRARSRAPGRSLRGGALVA